jgi:hypothetical protein
MTIAAAMVEVMGNNPNFRSRDREVNL